MMQSLREDLNADDVRYQMREIKEEPGSQPSDDINSLADAWSARLARMSQDERIAAWWASDGRLLVCALKQHKDHLPSYLEALAVATGDLEFHEEGYANVTPDFIDALERSCGQSAEYYLLAKSICTVNLSLQMLQPELQPLAALIMSGDLKKPRPGKALGGKTWHRDRLIVRGINSTLKHGIAPTRNDVSSTVSGCDLVIKAFDCAKRKDRPTYSVAKEAWNRRDEILTHLEILEFEKYRRHIASSAE